MALNKHKIVSELTKEQIERLDIYCKHGLKKWKEAEGSRENT